MNARCACNTLKKEWLCRDVQKAYSNAGRDPKDISKNHFGVGVLPCGTICANKIKGVESDLHIRKTNEIKVQLGNRCTILFVML